MQYTEEKLNLKRHHDSNELINLLREEVKLIQKEKHLSNRGGTKITYNHFIPAFEKYVAFVVTNNRELYVYNYDSQTYDKSVDTINQLYRKVIDEAPSRTHMTTIKDALIASEYAFEEMDLNSNLIPVKNGIINRDTKELINYDITRFVKHKLNVSYNPDVRYPEDVYEIDRFILDTANNDEERYYGLMQVINYALSGINPHHNIIIFLGEGGSGKSAINKLITSFIDDTQFAALKLNQFNHDKYLSELRDKRVSIGDDLSDGQYIGDLENLKTLSAQGSVTIDIKHKDSIHLKFPGLIIQNAARIPKFSESGTQLKRRLKVYNFKNKFTGAHRKMTNDEFNEMINNEDVKSYLLNQLLNISINNELRGTDEVLLDEVTSINDEYKSFIDSIQYTKLMTLDYIPNSVMRAIYLDINSQKLNDKTAISSGKLISLLKPYMEDLGYQFDNSSVKRPKSCIKQTAIFDDIDEDIDQSRKILFEDQEENGYSFDIKEGNYPNYETIMNKNTPSKCWVQKAEVDE